MDWRLTSVIKGKTEEGTSWYSNIVGTLQTENDEYIYKVSRLPSYKSYWEFLISDSIHKNLPSVKHFARVVDVQELLLDVDEEGRTIPSVKTNVSRRKERNVMIQKIIAGFPLAKHIKSGCSDQFIFGIIT